MIKCYLLQGIIQKETENTHRKITLYRFFLKNLVIPSKNMTVNQILYSLPSKYHFKDLSANFTDRYHVTTTV